MLENLVESKNNARAAGKLYGFLFSTFLVISAILLSATVWSLYAKDFIMGNDETELSTLTLPIPVDKDDEPQPQIEKTKQQNQPQNTKSQLPNRKSVIARIDEAQIAPDKVSTAPNSLKVRPNQPFTVNKNAAESDGSFSTKEERSDGSHNEKDFSLAENKSTIVENKTPKIPPAPPVLPKKEDVKKVSTIISIGVINGKATSLPKPPYPLPAKAVGASGAVNVQVTIDEQGNVVSAKAVSGHPLLRDAAERAARNAKFSPTYLSKVPVKVNGLIVYNFTR